MVLVHRHPAAKADRGHVRRAARRAGGDRSAQRRGAGLCEQAHVRPQPVRRRHRRGELEGAQRVAGQAAAQPRPARHLPARLHLQALHGAGRAGDRHAQRQHRSSTTPASGCSATTASAATATAAWVRWTCARSIVKSSNVYYYSLANEHGRGRHARLHGAAGFWPDHRHRPARRGARRAAQPGLETRRTTSGPSSRRWYAGETISLGIGQGYNSFTMLQLAQAMATLANGGIEHTAPPGAGHRQRCSPKSARSWRHRNHRSPWATSPNTCRPFCGPCTA